jgi:hypothetical protein
MPSAFVPVVKPTDRRLPISSKTANQLTSLLDGDDSRIFEIDRSDLVLQLGTLQRAIDEGATEIEMVAVEGVFVEPVSQALIRAARKLSRVSEDLRVLHRMVEQARPPIAPRRPPRKPMPRNRRKTPD